MVKKLLFVLFVTLSLSVFSENIIDVYSSDNYPPIEIIKKYGAKVGDIEGLFLKEIAKINNGGSEAYLLKTLLPKKNHLIEKIKKDFDLYFVDFQTVFYPGDKNQYTTIEVIKKNQTNRIRFIDKISMPENNLSKPDLIEKMVIFTNLEMQLLMSNQLTQKNNSCPVYHCISGFHHPKLKPYLKTFDMGVIKEKQLILDTLSNDANPERRAAAAFLLGHLDDPKEILFLLSHHVNDDSSLVRNNVIRVIASTMFKSKISQIDVVPFLTLLDSPYTTDRNKALSVLANAASMPIPKRILIKNAKNKLLPLLQLKQPNNHNLVYSILKKISGHDFGENNIADWEKWLDSIAK